MLAIGEENLLLLPNLREVGNADGYHPMLTSNTRPEE